MWLLSGAIGYSRADKSMSSPVAVDRSEPFHIEWVRAAHFFGPARKCERCGVCPSEKVSTTRSASFHPTFLREHRNAVRRIEVECCHLAAQASEQ